MRTGWFDGGGAVPIALVTVEVKLNPSDFVTLLAEHRGVSRALFARRQFILVLPIQTDEVDLSWRNTFSVIQSRSKGGHGRSASCARPGGEPGLWPCTRYA